MRHDFLNTRVPDDGSKHLWHGYPDECFSFTSFVDSLVGLLVCGGWFIQPPITIVRKAIVIDFVSEREAQAESSLAHRWSATWEFPMGTTTTKHSRVEVNEQNAKLGRHLTLIGSAMTHEDFFHAVGEKLLDHHNCTDPSCTICATRIKRRLADVFQILASGTMQSEVHLFSRYKPSPAIIEPLRADGIALIAHDLDEIPLHDLEANQYYHLWDGTEDQGHEFRKAVWAPDWKNRANELEARQVRCCPRCGSLDLLPIQYGLPTDDGFAAADRGEIKLGGCVIGADSPQWHCRSCKHEFVIS
jgi:hypothetical protein